MPYSYRSTLSYQYDCMVQPIPFSVLFGGAYAAYSVMASSEPSSRHKRYQNAASSIAEHTIWRRAGTAIGTLYLYYALQCPMEAVHGRSSSLHNGASAFTMSYIALSRQWIGVPFIPPYYLMDMPFFARTILGSSIYGTAAIIVASTWGGKRF